jgi:hypothetical protein
MYIKISLGEGLDRLSILEIKLAEIVNIDDKKFILNEIESLNEIVTQKTQFQYYYNLLLFVNKLIWIKTDEIKTMSISEEYAILAKTIFDLNQSRFRIKNIINKLCSSAIRECKSYAPTSVNISIMCAADVDITKLTYLSLTFDIVTIMCNKDVIERMRAIPLFNYEYVTTIYSYININDIHVTNEFSTLKVQTI